MKIGKRKIFNNSSLGHFSLPPSSQYLVSFLGLKLSKIRKSLLFCRSALTKHALMTIISVEISDIHVHNHYYFEFREKPSVKIH